MRDSSLPGISLKVILEKEAGMSKVLIVLEKGSMRSCWIWIETSHPKYNLDKFDLEDEKWILLTTLP